MAEDVRTREVDVVRQGTEHIFHAEVLLPISDEAIDFQAEYLARVLAIAPVDTRTYSLQCYQGAASGAMQTVVTKTIITVSDR